MKGMPVVFGLVDESAAALRRLPPGVTGVTDRIAARETLDLALALFPDTQRLALVGGASAQDLPLNEMMRREVAASGRQLELVGLFGLPMGELEARLRALPTRTVVLVVALFQDGAGRQWQSWSVSSPKPVPGAFSGRGPMTRTAARATRRSRRR